MDPEKNKKQNEVQLLSLIDVPIFRQCGADCVTLVNVDCSISNPGHVKSKTFSKSNQSKYEIIPSNRKVKTKTTEVHWSWCYTKYLVVHFIPSTWCLYLELIALRWSWWEYPVYKAWFNILFDVSLLPTLNHRDSFHTIIIAWSQATSICLLE